MADLFSRVDSVNWRSRAESRPTASEQLRSRLRTKAETSRRLSRRFTVSACAQNRRALIGRFTAQRRMFFISCSNRHDTTGAPEDGVALGIDLDDLIYQSTDCGVSTPRLSTVARTV
jgi:hypothetical protein